MNTLHGAPDALPEGRKFGSTYTVRLPVALASRVEALREMNPHKSQSALLGDLVGVGLAQVEKAWQKGRPTPLGPYANGHRPIDLLSGPFAEFHGLVHKHYIAVEREAAQDGAEPIPPLNGYALGADA